MVHFRHYANTTCTCSFTLLNSVKVYIVCVESEPMPELQAVVSTLSTGPVGPGDMVGGTNRSLLMR